MARLFLRVQSSTLAQAVLCEAARWLRPHRCIPSGELRLPYVELDGWEPVGTQVQMWVSGMLRHPAKLKLAAIEGTQGRKGVTFLYSPRCEVCRAKSATLGLRRNLRRLLSLSTIGVFCSLQTFRARARMDCLGTALPGADLNSIKVSLLDSARGITPDGVGTYAFYHRLDAGVALRRCCSSPGLADRCLPHGTRYSVWGSPA